ncbi:unnamed protein product [Lactuca saligna]|uniref:Uncharacterized protein n=1 Tax=Lactuca saligna TaxID=75948 RepID=A0AA35V5R8_LACSI|nr:unnamed protein product [Lactuca saligna]
MSTSMRNPDGLYPIVELNFKGVFLRDPFLYNHGIKLTFKDHDFPFSNGSCKKVSRAILLLCAEEEDGNDNIIDDDGGEEEENVLIEVVKELLPYVEHRQRAKRFSQKLRKRHRGAQYENIFWKACKATTKLDFKISMKELEDLDPSTHKYLMVKDPKTWSRAYYETGRCYDAMVNRMYESFNVVIIDARKKPIITMLEELRFYMMGKVFNMKAKGKG